MVTVKDDLGGVLYFEKPAVDGQHGEMTTVMSSFYGETIAWHVTL